MLTRAIGSKVQVVSRSGGHKTRIATGYLVGFNDREETIQIREKGEDKLIPLEDDVNVVFRRAVIYGRCEDTTTEES